MKTFFKNISNLNKIRLCNQFQYKFSFSFSNIFNKSPSECYYKTLKSSPSSNIEDIKKEYYKLANKFHPDNKNSESKENQSVKLLF